MSDRPLVDWPWVGSHLDDIAERTVQHLTIAAIAVVSGFLISGLLAIWSVRSRRVYGPVMAVAGVLYTVPSLALFAALIPFTGLSLLTAVIPLTLYTLLILVRNIVAGFDSVPAEVVEAAEGMGYRRAERLRLVEVPLALPLIIAGLRLATVSTIGLVTVAAVLGENLGGLGVLITEGLQTFFPTKVYAGVIPSIVLAVAADLGFVALQRRITPWSRARAEGLGR